MRLSTAGRAAVDVLLVEDDELVRMCLAEGLGDAGWRVAEASSGGQALALAELDGGSAVLVTDLYLGCGMDGTELVALARRRWPRLRAVLISGADVAGTSLGPGDRFLRKPFRLDALVGVIQELAAGQIVPAAAVPLAVAPE